MSVVLMKVDTKSFTISSDTFSEFSCQRLNTFKAVFYTTITSSCVHTTTNFYPIILKSEKFMPYYV